jgi:hypothetical protein
MQNQTNIIVVWFNALTSNQECHFFKKEELELANKYASMIKTIRTCTKVKLYETIPIAEP